jgi:nucleotide-binding universal stress UspA family protein
MKNILVPTDFCAHAGYALEYACTLASKLGASVHLLNVVDLGDLGVVVPEERVRELGISHYAELSRIRELFESRCTIASALVRFGNAREEILSAADTVGADMIVMGTHGRSGLSRILLGSVTEGVLREAPCPVISVRPPLSMPEAKAVHA